MLQDYFLGAPQSSRSCGTENKNVLRSIELPSKCHKIKLLECANFGAIGSIGGIGHISKAFPVHLELGGMFTESDFDNVYVKWLNLNNNLSPAHLDLDILT